jgi:Ni,Fe-hydrogenase III large subunit
VLFRSLERLQPGREEPAALSGFRKDSLAVSVVEGWRGEVAHVALTDRSGRIARYKIKDPSFNNWFGLALAVRGNGVSDFPLCNKSFNLSYAGFDL